MKKVVSIVIAIGLLWTIISTINQTNSDNKDQTEKSSEKVEELAKVNFKSPSFKLKGLDGKTYSLKSLTENGKPVVLNFWASWCGPCKIEAPELVKLYDQYNDKLEIYAINMTESDSISGAERFAKQFGFEFPVLLDIDGDVVDKYNIVAVPTTYFVDEEGIIVDQIVGFGGTEILEKKMKKLVTQ